MRVILFLVLFSNFSALASGPAAQEIVRRADEARGPKGTFSFHVKVEDQKKDETLRTTDYKVYSKDADLTLIETLLPERLRGRKLLMRANDLWLYLPSIKRPTRVSFQQKLTGEVANGDVARTLLERDYEPKLEAREKRNERETYKLQLTATNKKATYRAITYWVEVDTFFPVEMQYQAISGKLIKIGTYSEPKMVMGKTRMTRLTISDVQSLHKSILVYSNYKSEQLEDSFFSKESLAD